MDLMYAITKAKKALDNRRLLARMQVDRNTQLYLLLGASLYTIGAILQRMIDEEFELLWFSSPVAICLD